MCKEPRKVLVEKVYVNNQYTYDVVGWYMGLFSVGDEKEGFYPHAAVELMIGKVVLVPADTISFLDTPVEDLLKEHPLMGQEVLISDGEKTITGKINRLNSMNKGADGIAWVTKYDGSGELKVKFKDGHLVTEANTPIGVCLKESTYEFKEY